MKLFHRQSYENKRSNKRPQLYRMKRSVLDSIKLCSMSLGFIIVFLGASRFFVGSSYFKVADVQITGDLIHLNKDQIEKLAQVPYGKNLFMINLYKIGQNIKRYRWIHYAQVRRRFPQGLEIHVEEYKPAAILVASHGDASSLELRSSKNSDYYYMSQTGIIFKKVSKDEPLDYPLITGFNKDAMQKYPVYFQSKISEAFHFLKDFLEQPKSQDFIVTGLHYDVAQGIEMSIHLLNQTDVIKVYFGNGDYEEALNRWAQFADELKKEDIHFRFVDLHVKDRIFARI